MNESQHQTVAIRLTVNGEPVAVDVQPRQLLVHLLRDQLDLTGTVIGCDTSNCGSCTMLLDGAPVKSCTVLAVQADGAELTTIEGVATDGTWHPVQEAFHRHFALQCGFCTPGMILASIGLLADTPDPTEDEVRAGLDGNLCRCTGYERIVDAVRDAAGQLGESS